MQNDDTKILIDMNDKLSDYVTILLLYYYVLLLYHYNNVVILMTCIIKDDDKCYPQIFLEEGWFVK